MSFLFVYAIYCYFRFKNAKIHIFLCLVFDQPFVDLFLDGGDYLLRFGI